MRISEYSFGIITIDDRVYTADVLIFPEYVFSPWWRLEGHRLGIEDLQQSITASPSELVIGTGYHGSMVVPPETLDYLRKTGIEPVVCPTMEAVKIFNDRSVPGPLAAAFHLTC